MSNWEIVFDSLSKAKTVFGERFDAAVAFVKRSGVQLLADSIRWFAETNGDVRVVKLQKPIDRPNHAEYNEDKACRFCAPLIWRDPREAGS